MERTLLNIGFGSSVVAERVVVIVSPNSAPMKRSDLFFELGWCNEAIHMAHESIEIGGEHPRALRQLARLYVIKGQH